MTKANKEEFVLAAVRALGTCGQRKNMVGPLPNWRDAHYGRLQPPEELELLVVGIPDLDFDALEKNTKYEGGYDESTEVVKNFWKFVKESNSDDRGKLLKFATASSKAPIGGLGKINFIIQKAGTDSANLPTSHTCFNT